MKAPDRRWICERTACSDQSNSPGEQIPMDPLRFPIQTKQNVQEDE